MGGIEFGPFEFGPLGGSRRPWARLTGWCDHTLSR